MLDKDAAAQHGTTNHTTSSHYTTQQQAAVHWGAAFIFPQQTRLQLKHKDHVLYGE
jgi:hypothetical protein